MSACFGTAEYSLNNVRRGRLVGLDASPVQRQPTTKMRPNEAHLLARPTDGDDTTRANPGSLIETKSIPNVLRFASLLLRLLDGAVLLEECEELAADEHSRRMGRNAHPTMRLGAFA